MSIGTIMARMSAAFLSGSGADFRLPWQQWAMVDPKVQPTGFSRGTHGEIVVEVHETVRDLGGELLSERRVGHIFRIENELVTRFDIREP